MSLKITTLIENMPDERGQLTCEHGFSVWVESDNYRVLFDTGQTGAFADNAKKLGIDLSALDCLVLSHGHYDHTGGVPQLLECLERKIPVYVGKEFFAPKYKQLEDGSYKYNGNPFEKDLLAGNAGENQKTEVYYIEETVTKLSERLFLFKNFPRTNGFEQVNPKFFVQTKQGQEQDLFPDEIALGILTDRGIVLIVGCSHVGIVNILETVTKATTLPVAAVIGGTHLVEADEERLTETAAALKKFGVKTVAVSHCTGEAGMELLKKEFPAGFVLNTTGNVMEF